MPCRYRNNRVQQSNNLDFQKDHVGNDMKTNYNSVIISVLNITVSPQTKHTWKYKYDSLACNVCFIYRFQLL